MTFIVDGTSGLTFPNSTTQASGGKVIQVIQGITNTTVTNATATYADTGLTATITPLFSTSKILVLVNQSALYGGGTTAQGGGINILRNSTVISLTPSDATGPFDNYFNVGSGAVTRLSLSYLDSPATTSSIVYKTQGRPYATAIGGFSTYQYTGTVSGTSTIILMEIAV